MKQAQAAQWLVEQLPALVAQGVVNRDAAEALRVHYTPQAAVPAQSSRSIAVVIFSILGGLLISAGIILLFAHNWDQLSRPARTVLSFLPLVIGIALSALSIQRKNHSVALAEAAGAFHGIAIGACIALIGQTYQLPGSFPKFLLVWMLLSFPLVYLLRSAAVAILYLAGITTWAGENVIAQGTMYWAWPLLLLVVPFHVALIRENRFSGRTWWVSLAVALALPVAAGFQCDRGVFYIWPLVFSGIFASLYLAGCRWFRKPDAPRVAHPFIFIGQLGVVVLTIWLGYGGAWEHRFRSFPSELPSYVWITGEALAYGFCAFALALLAIAWKQKANANFVAGLLPVVVLAGNLLLRVGVGWTVLLLNLYGLVLGIVTIMRGIRDLRFASLNGGLLLVAALIAFRFFDSDIGFILKGVAFIVVGAGFCGANLILLKKRKAAVL